MWHRLSSNYQSIEALYKNEFPSLIGVRLRIIDVQSGSIRLLFDPPNFPSEPPYKWISKGYNTVNIEISLLNLLEADLKITGPYEYCNLSIQQEKNHLSLKIEAVNIQMSATFEFLFINGIGAYLFDDSVI